MTLNVGVGAGVVLREELLVGDVSGVVLIILEFRQSSQFLEFDELLDGEGEELDHVGVQLRFVGDRVRDVKEGARSVENDLLGVGAKNVDFIERGFVIATPDVLSVDDAREEDLVGGESVVGDELGGSFSLDEIESDRVEVQSAEFFVAVADVAKVCLSENAQRTFFRQKFLVDGDEESDFVGGQVGNEGGFVKLEPFCAEGIADAKELFVSVEDRGEELRLRLGAGRFGELEEGERSDDDGLRLNAERFRLTVRVDKRFTTKFDRHIVVKLGNHVVIVRVEPLLHGEGLDVPLLSLIAVSHREIDV